MRWSPTWDWLDAEFPIGAVDPQKVSALWADQDVWDFLDWVAKTVTVQRRVPSANVEDVQQEAALVLHRIIIDPVARAKSRRFKSVQVAVVRATTMVVKKAFESGDLSDGLAGAAAARRRFAALRRFAQAHPGMSPREALAAYNAHVMASRKDAVRQAAVVSPADWVAPSPYAVSVQSALGAQSQLAAAEDVAMIRAGTMSRIGQLGRITQAMLALSDGEDGPSVDDVAKLTGLGPGRVCELLPMAQALIRMASTG